MLKKPFFGLNRQTLEYAPLGSTPAGDALQIASPKHVTLLAETICADKKDILIKIGDTVKSGQKLTIVNGRNDYVIATISGTISSISSFSGGFGEKYTAIEIDADGTPEIDDQFKNAGSVPSLASVNEFLACVPGKPRISFNNPPKAVNSIIIDGTETDILIATRQYVLKTDVEAIKKGIEVLKKITGTGNIIVAAQEGSMQEAAAIGVKSAMISSVYPSAHPHLIIKELTGSAVPAGSKPEDRGHFFLSAESVASIGKAYASGCIPVEKILTVIKKDGTRKIVSVVIGTAIGDILKATGEKINEGERIIMGGPMTGSAVYSETYPVQPDTEAIMVQGGSDIPFVIDNACINCGECVRICPMKIPVNLLVRYLEAGQYADAAENYDLNCCIECGLCSYVCTSQMPVFQYIKFGKYELARIQKAEAEAEAAEAAAESAEAEHAS